MQAVEHLPKSQANSGKIPLEDLKTDSYNNDIEGTKEVIYLYIQPRRISIYAPKFKYGPNRQYSDDENETLSSDEKETENFSVQNPFVTHQGNIKNANLDNHTEKVIVCEKPEDKDKVI
ncbi:Protein TIC 214 [Caenorhabditis elegans]|uniref:Protein TIC 214 n=1 Tax=Caenorhabditis elegans TaxID=6239 RepID=Q19575_CAEEL|nr:Protein TIC 214 [Caenorhabditis elegans]CCD61929.1 Protein TIC 214 [Caenorhabditis elegans]|eukprot:NP_509560.1 Uncharacterized protein CELE_F18G5.1 [Caenorhabditis elegans]